MSDTAVATEVEATEPDVAVSESEPARSFRWSELSNVAFIAALIAGAVIRALYVRGRQGGINSDNGVVYLMARHAAHGHFQAFFWTENYGGSLLEDTTGLVFRITGAHIIGLQIIEAIIFLGAVVLMREVLRRVTDVRVANIAAALVWLAPLSVIYSVQDPGYVSVGLAVAFGALLCALEYKGRVVLIAATGLLLGLCWWTTPLSLLLAWPALAVVWFARRRPVHLGVFAVGAVVGALPWVWRNVASQFSSVSPREGHGSLIGRTHDAITVLAPAAFDSIHGTFTHHHPAVAGFVAFGGLLAAFIVMVVQRHYVVAAGLACGLLWPVFIALTGFSIVPTAARYGAFLLPALALAIALATRWISLPIVGALALATVLLFGSWLHAPTSDPRNDPAFTQVADYLVANHRTHIWSTYWVGYVFESETQERVTVAGTTSNRYEPWRRLAQNAPTTTVLVRSGKSADRELAHITGGTRMRFGRWALWQWPRPIHVPALTDK